MSFLARLAFAALLVAGMARPAVAEDIEVDVELVLAVDISYSMDMDELELQRGGYVAAFRSAEIKKAIASGAIGRIAVLYVEWAGAQDQRVVVPWTLIDGAEAADAFAARLAAQPVRRAYRTSIAGAIDFAVPRFEENRFKGARRVLDISGDGPNNQGRLVTRSREDALAKGIVINGLPIVLKRGGWGDMDNLDDYYQDCVIGGVGSFLVPIRERDQFADAIRTKILREVADLGPLPIHRAQVERRTKTDCEIGEKMWRERWERGN